MRDQNQGVDTVVSGSQVLSAGLASTGAAFVTSRFGVAGTLIGAALTAVIITGGSAILKAYIESVTGTVRGAPGKLRARFSGRAGKAKPPRELPNRPDLRNNFAGRMRAALGWFSRLPTPNRRSILRRGLVAAAVAFVIGMGAVYLLERGVVRNSLSCGVWGACAAGQAPGFGGGAASAGGSSTFDRVLGGGPAGGAGGEADGGAGGGLIPGGDPAPDPSASPAAEEASPAADEASPAAEEASPAPEEEPAADPAESAPAEEASPAAEEGASPDPASASPAP